MGGMHIVFVTSEVAGIFKLGGLADVCQALPESLVKLGHTVTILLPYYSTITDVEVKLLGTSRILYDGIPEIVEVYSRVSSSTPVRILLLKHRKLDAYHGDNIFDTFIFFSFVAARLCIAFETFFPEKVDIVHCHDWHTSLVPVLLKSKKWQHDSLEQSKVKNIPTVLTIHNLMYSGIIRDEKLKKIIVSLDHWNGLGDINSQNIIGRKNTLSLLREGLECCDVISTVSPTYAKEISITQEPPIGDVLVRRNKNLFGILNGIDTSIWSPQLDANIQIQYDTNTVEINKKLNKKSLQKYSKLPTDDIYMIGFVGRIEPRQKGIDIIMNSLSTLISNRNIQVIFLGTGDDETEDKLKRLEHEYQQKICFINAFDDKLAHMIYAGCDALLVPSKFEPCGLTQLIAMRYGSLPIVRKTGGLADTVTDTVTGFVFPDYSSDSLSQKIIESYELWTQNRGMWNGMVQSAMEQDFSWSNSAIEYEKLYVSLSPRSEFSENQ